MLVPADEQRCSFCAINLTVSSLDAAGTTPICYRPCYVALCLLRTGVPPKDALEVAFTSYGDDLTMRRAVLDMYARGWEPPATAGRLAAHLYAGYGMRALEAGG